MVAAEEYMAQIERLYAVDSAVAADDGNDGGEGWESKAGAPRGDGIARVNGQAAATRGRWTAACGAVRRRAVCRSGKPCR